MTLLDLINSAWAIEPAKHAQMRELYEAHVRGEKIDIAAVEAQLGRPLAREQQGYTVQNGVAIIPVDGVIAQKANLFSRISGGASSQLIERDIRGALAEGAVRAIVLEINSPGGTVHGTQELANLIDAARAEKPIAAYATGQMASAAYWIGAAADRVYISGDNVFTGSIGIVATHVDRSKQDEQMGVKRTEIVAGKYKRVASDLKPLDKDGLAHMQEFVDYLYSVFVNDVAAFRGVAVERVVSAMADGRVFIGRQAIDAGLVDGVSTLDALVDLLAAGQMPRRAVTRKQAFVHAPSGGAPAGRGAEADAGAGHDAKAGGAPAEASADPTGGAPAGEAREQDKPSNQPGAENEMDKITRERILAETPELATAFIAEGATAERARILAVESQMLPGHAALINTLKFDGKTTGDQAAAQVLAAERGKLGKTAADLAADAGALNAIAPTASATAASASAAAAAAAAEAAKPLAERCKAKWDADAELRGSYGNDYSAYVAFEKANEAGRVKVLGAKNAA